MSDIVSEYRYRIFDYLNAEEILDKKGLIYNVMENINQINKIGNYANYYKTLKRIGKLFETDGWEINKEIFKDYWIKWFAFKDRTLVIIDIITDYAILEPALLWLIAWKNSGKIDVGIYAVPDPDKKREGQYVATFEYVKPIINELKPILNVPIYLIGLKNI